MILADGSNTECKSSVGTGHIVATDFNPLNIKIIRANGSSLSCESSLGTKHIIATDFNPLNVE